MDIVVRDIFNYFSEDFLEEQLIMPNKEASIPLYREPLPYFLCSYNYKAFKKICFLKTIFLTSFTIESLFI